MVNVKYIGLKDFGDQNVEEIKQIIEAYKPKFERSMDKGELTVGIKPSHILGGVGRFTINLMLASTQGKLHAEQSGWGLAKTLRRSCEHMTSLLEHKMRKEMLEHKPRKLKK